MTCQATGLQGKRVLSPRKVHESIYPLNYIHHQITYDSLYITEPRRRSRYATAGVFASHAVLPLIAG